MSDFGICCPRPDTLGNIETLDAIKAELANSIGLEPSMTLHQAIGPFLDFYSLPRHDRAHRRFFVLNQIPANVNDHLVNDSSKRERC
jgi:hypothetical protein